MLEFAEMRWTPEPAYFLPKELFVAAILKSNVRLPHLSHTACPTCLPDGGGPSAGLEAEAAALRGGWT